MKSDKNYLLVFFHSSPPRQGKFDAILKCDNIIHCLQWPTVPIDTSSHRLIIPMPLRQEDFHQESMSRGICGLHVNCRCVNHQMWTVFSRYLHMNPWFFNEKMPSNTLDILTEIVDSSIREDRSNLKKNKKWLSSNFILRFFDYFLLPHSKTYL